MPSQFSPEVFISHDVPAPMQMSATYHSVTYHRFTLVASCAVVLLGSVLFQGCDALQDEPAPNPTSGFYVKVGQVYKKASSATVESVRVGLRDPSNQWSVQKLAQQGFTQWAERNGSDAKSFERGITFTEKQAKRAQWRGRAGTSRASAPSAPLDSLLDGSDLSEPQKRYVRKIPNVGQGAATIDDLHGRARAFSEHVAEDLGEEAARPVVAITSVVMHQLEFMIGHAEELAAMQRAVAGDGETGAVYLRLPAGGSGGFRFTQSGPSDPPSWRDHVNQSAMIVSTMEGMFGGVMGGASAGAKFASLGGPVSALGGGILGGLAGGALGGMLGVGKEYVVQLEDFRKEMKKWCDDEINTSHPDYASTCNEG